VSRRVVFGFALVVPSIALGQGSVTGGAREILALSFANAQPGQIPAGLRLINGSVDVVDKDGARMLRAKGPAEFLVTLPEALPTNFTLEFDLIAKEEGGSDDLAFDGTSGRSSTSSFAMVQWSPTTQTVSGGGLNTSSPFTMTVGAMSEALPGQLAKIIASFEGNTLRLYTNGVRLYTVTDRVFARGTVLRVLLGGQSEENPVYLARLRVAGGAAATVVATQQSSLVTTTTSPSGGTVQAVGAAAPAATITPLPAAPPPASAGAVSQGPVVTRPSSSRTGVATGSPAPPPPLAPGLPARAITLSGFTVVGLSTSIAPRTVTLSGFTAVGNLVSIAPKSVTLSGFTAAGTFGPLAPRTITLSGFTAAGGFVGIISKTVTLSGFTAAGTFEPLAPRTITLSGFTAVGEFTRLPPRTVTLSGFTAVGITP
jgi:hypothetical protein